MQKTNKVKDILKDAKVTPIKSLRYDRRKGDFVEEHNLLVHTKDEAVGKERKRLERKGALFEGDFSELPADARQRLYDEARAKALKWYEEWCDECDKPIDLFDKELWKVEESKGSWGEEERLCEKCLKEKPYTGDELINDTILSKKIGSRELKYTSLHPDNDVIACRVGGEVRIITQKEYPKTFKILAERGEEVCQSKVGEKKEGK